MTQRLFVVNGAASSIDVLGIADPTHPTLLFSIEVTPYGDQANSVAVRDGVVAAAVQADPKTDPGKVVFFDAGGAHLGDVTVGALPDMLTFTPNGERVLVANEGEPNGYNQPGSLDPEGSVSIVDLRAGFGNLTDADVTTARLTPEVPRVNPQSIRVYGPNATPAQDFEPEYVAVSHDSRTARVTLRENDAVALLNAAREARKAAARARGFADLCEKYAERLLTPGCEMGAAGLRTRVKDNFAELREALSDSDDWARIAERRTGTPLIAAGS